MDSLLPLAKQVGEKLKARKETVGVSESSAGGLISAVLLAVPGASAYFMGGAVVYLGPRRNRRVGSDRQFLRRPRRPHLRRGRRPEGQDRADAAHWFDRQSRKHARLRRRGAQAAGRAAILADAKEPYGPALASAGALRAVGAVTTGELGRRVGRAVVTGKLCAA
jgi:hypothetical protein